MRASVLSRRTIQTTAQLTTPWSLRAAHGARPSRLRGKKQFLMKWCCATFRLRHDRAGQMGVAVISYQDSRGQLQFVIQHRAVDHGLEDSVRAEIPTQVISDVHIDYCPWCGRNLKSVYGKDVDSLLRPNLKIAIPDE